MKKFDINLPPQNSQSFLPPLYFVKNHLKLKGSAKILRNSSIFKSSTNSTSKFDSKDGSSLMSREKKVLNLDETKYKAFFQCGGVKSQSKLKSEKSIGYTNFNSAKELTDYKTFLTNCNTGLIDKMITKNNNEKGRKVDLEPKYLKNKKSENSSLASLNEIQNVNTSFFKSFEENQQNKVLLSNFMGAETLEKEKTDFFKNKPHFIIKQRVIEKVDEAYFKHLNKQQKALHLKKNSQKSFLSEFENVYKDFAIKNEGNIRRKNEKKIQVFKKISDGINNVVSEQNKLMDGLMKTFEKHLEE